MPLGDFEKQILRLLAANRNPDSYMAGASILNRSENSPRASQDIDLFHDTEESILDAASRDRSVLEQHNYHVELGPPQPTFQRGIVTKEECITKIEWVFDSAFRFFPIQPKKSAAFSSMRAARPSHRTRRHPASPDSNVTSAACAAPGLLFGNSSTNFTP